MKAEESPPVLPPDIFFSGIKANPQFACLAERPLPARPLLPGPLDLRVPGNCAGRIWFDALIEGWHDQDSAREITRGLHELALERAAQPPVVHVTVTSPAGQPALPGHFQVQTGPERQVRYVDGPDIPDAAPASETTRAASERIRYGAGEPASEEA